MKRTGPDYEKQMPGTGMTVEQVRIVSCPRCGAGSTDKCWYPTQADDSALRISPHVHRARCNKALAYKRAGRL